MVVVTDVDMEKFELFNNEMNFCNGYIMDDMCSLMCTLNLISKYHATICDLQIYQLCKIHCSIILLNNFVT